MHSLLWFLNNFKLLIINALVYDRENYQELQEVPPHMAVASVVLHFKVNSVGVSAHNSVTLAASSSKPDVLTRLEGECEAALSPVRTNIPTSQSCFTSLMNNFFILPRH